MREVEERLFLLPLTKLVDRLSYTRALERAWQLLEQGYADADLCLDRIARLSGANRNHLNVLFRRSTKFTVHQLLIRYRLWKAVTMMMAKDYTLTEIAYENGFGSVTSFQRNFRRILGVTPREFKAKSLEDKSHSSTDEQADIGDGRRPPARALGSRLTSQSAA